MIERIEHVAIFAKDVNTLKRWYEEIFGLQKVYSGGKEVCFLKAPGGMMLEFLKAEEENPLKIDKTQGVGHIAFFVSDFERDIKALKDKGIKIDLNPAELSEEKKMVFFPDPEGNILQIIYRKIPLE